MDRPTHNLPVRVISDLCADLLIQGNVTPRYNQEEQLVDDYELELGGSAAIFASQLARLGREVSLYGLVGDDLFGEYLVTRLRERGIVPVVDKSADAKTSVGLGLVRGTDRAMLTYDGSMRAMDPVMIFSESFFQKPFHLHLCSYFLLPRFQDHWPEAIRRVHAEGGTVSLDTNWAPQQDWGKVHPLLPEVDVFIPNEQEAMHISGKSSLAGAGEWLADRCKLVVVKCGAEGAMVFSGKNSYAFGIPESLTSGLRIADTTGAGDNFDAGFIHAWLNGENPESCVYKAMCCGTMSLREIGGIAGQIEKGFFDGAY